MLTSNYKPHTN